MRVTVLAPAKINLSLDITGKRGDGYHLVRMVMQAVDLYDTVSVTLTDGAVEVTCSNKDVPTGPENLACRAAECFLQAAGRSDAGVSIKIKKRIPMAAGLAGGSADAAAVLVALNRLMGEPFDQARLADLGESIGADVPFCITGGAMLAEGIGTLFSPLPDFPACSIVLCKPDCGVSTKEAYSRFDELEEVHHPDVDEVAEAVCAHDLELIAKAMGNVFEQAVDLPDVKSIKEVMLEGGALGSCMTGSGPTVFGLFADKGEADRCAFALGRTYDEVFVVHPIPGGCEID